MVRAILDGRKSQTRRIVKLRVVPIVEECFRVNGKWCNHTFDYDLVNLCPYGVPGDRLWVKETHSFWCHSIESVGVEYASGGDDKVVDFPGKAGMPPLSVQVRKTISGKRVKRPSIFMPRWASRITLENTSVRVERLQDISEADAIAEGVEKLSHGFLDYSRKLDAQLGDARASYFTLWESINGEGSWALNPWVWVIEFKRV
jgi:hypothetical protein